MVTTAFGREIANVKVLSFSAERAEILFEPVEGPGEYHVYFLPYRHRTRWADMRYDPDWTDCLPVKYAASDDWLAVAATAQTVPATLVAFEARSDFECFTPLGLAATAEETARVSAAHAVASGCLQLQSARSL